MRYYIMFINSMWHLLQYSFKGIIRLIDGCITFRVKFNYYIVQQSGFVKF